MIRVSIFYPHAPGKRFDFEYYRSTHAPFARRLLGGSGLVRLEVDRGVSSEEPGSAPLHVAVAHLYFETLADFYDAMAAHGDALAEDVPRYTDIELAIQVSEIVD